MLPGKTFFSFRLFSSTSGCQFICSSREQQRQFEHLSKPVFISREKKKKKGNKWYSTVWVNCFKFRSIPVGLRRATHGVRAHFTVIEWKTLSPFQHYILPCSMYPDGISICMHNLQFSSKKLKNLVFANAGTLWLSKVSRGWQQLRGAAAASLQLRSHRGQPAPAEKQPKSQWEQPSEPGRAAAGLCGRSEGKAEI